MKAVWLLALLIFALPLAACAKERDRNFEVRSAPQYAPTSAEGRAEARSQFEELLPKAEANVPLAMWELGSLYGYSCLEICYDHKNQHNWYLKAAKLGLVEAMASLAELYLNRNADLVDLEQAAFWYEKAFAAGNISSGYELARKYLNGEDFARNPIKAFALYRRLSYAGDGRADSIMARMLEKGEGVAQDKFQAVKRMQMAARKGEDYALHTLIGAYLTGNGFAGLPKDLVKSFYWQKRAAEIEAKRDNGFTDRYRLSGLYAQGIGTKKNSKKAFELVKQITKDESYTEFEAHLTLASFFEKGEGVGKDLNAAKMHRERGLAILTKSAERDELAKFQLGRIYAEAKIITRDDRKAVFYLSQAYNRGQGIVAFYAGKFLADLYAEGRGVPRDLHYARKLYQEAVSAKFEAASTELKKDIFVNLPPTPTAYYRLIGDEVASRASAEQGNVLAMRVMGDIYSDPSFAPRDPAISRAWYQLAADGGDEQAKVILERIK